MTLIIAPTSSAGTVLYSYEWISDQPFNGVGRSGDYAALLGRIPGAYLMRLLISNSVIAEGQFTLK